MIIWIASYPRSGNTFFRILVHHFFGMSTYKLHERKNPSDEIARLVGDADLPMPLDEIKRAREPYFVKTHEISQDNSPAIYIVRDGRDVLVSYAWFIHLIDLQKDHIDDVSFRNTLHDLIVYNESFGGWGPHVLSWNRRSAPTAVIKFDNLIENPWKTVQEALSSIGCQFERVNQEDPPKFSRLQQVYPQFFRKGKVGNWRKELPLDLQDQFWDRHGDAMRELGYTKEHYNKPKLNGQFVRPKNQKSVIYAESALEKSQDSTPMLNDTPIQISENELAAKDYVIAQQRIELMAKERVIQSLAFHQKFSILYWLICLLKPLSKVRTTKTVGTLEWIFTEYFSAQYGEHTLYQHDPIPLRISENYHTVPPSADGMTPLVSIVTPSFNQGAFLERTIRSVNQQEYPNLEYIIQDGGSTDGTNKVLEKYRPHLKHVESKSDEGQAQAINLGFRHATGDIMSWLNSDDMLLPGAVTYVMNYFSRNPDIDVVYGHRIYIDEHDDEVGCRVMPAHDAEVLNWVDYIPQETLFWRRSIWENVGGAVDESFRFALDWDLLLRFQESGAKIVRLPRFLGAFRVHPSQKTTSWHEVGEKEANHLRKRLHGRDVSEIEVLQNVKSFVRRLAWHKLLYRLKLIRH